MAGLLRGCGCTVLLYSELVVELALGDGTRGECVRSVGGTVRGSTDILPELA